MHFAYIAQITANSCFGVGAVVGKLGLPSVNPMMFATCRECGASILLTLAAWHMHGFLAPTLKGSSGDGRGRGTIGLAILCGFSILSGQLLFLVGLKMSNPITASVWQPSQPIFTLMMAVALGQEKLSTRKLGGILVAFAGCVYMVLSGGSSSNNIDQNESDGSKGEAAGVTTRHSSSAWVPHLFFFFNCLGTPVYILASKRLMKTMPPLWVTAWSYIMVRTCTTLSNMLQIQTPT